MVPEYRLELCFLKQRNTELASPCGRLQGIPSHDKNLIAKFLILADLPTTFTNHFPHAFALRVVTLARRCGTKLSRDFLISAFNGSLQHFRNDHYTDHFRTFAHLEKICNSCDDACRKNDSKATCQVTFWAWSNLIESQGRLWSVHPVSAAVKNQRLHGHSTDRAKSHLRQSSIPGNIWDFYALWRTFNTLSLPFHYAFEPLYVCCAARIDSETLSRSFTCRNTFANIWEQDDGTSLHLLMEQWKITLPGMPKKTRISNAKRVPSKQSNLNVSVGPTRHEMPIF